MSNSPHAAAAATARQRLAGVLGSLQQDAQIPPSVLEVLSGLARAIGPLFQLERGSADLQLFVQARSVLQETLEKMQTVDQSYPGISDATGAIAQSLGTIFTAMREAGMLANHSPSAAPAQPAAPAAPPAAAAPVAPAQPAPGMQPAPVAPAAVTPSFNPTVAGAPAPVVAQPAAMPQPQPYPQSAPVAAMPQAQPLPYPQPAPVAAPPVAMQMQPKPMAMQMQPAGGPQRAPSTHAMKPVVPSAAATLPIGPNGVPRFESEIGVHTETNFFTDFLGDIRNHGGIFVATFHDLAVNAPCEVFLTFPGNLTAELRGTVRWKREASPTGSLSSSPGLGVEITYADAKAWDLIDRFIRKREPIMHES